MSLSFDPDNVTLPIGHFVGKRMRAAVAAPTWDERAQYSPIISERQRIHSIDSTTVAAGDECLIGGGPMDAPGHFHQPTLIGRVDMAAPAVREEIFGPVQTFREEEEALSLADHPTYGLAAGRSRDHIQPTGGNKQSGIGKDLGRKAYFASRKSKSVLVSL